MNRKSKRIRALIVLGLNDKTITSFCDAHIIPFGLPGGGQNLLFYNIFY